MWLAKLVTKGVLLGVNNMFLSCILIYVETLLCYFIWFHLLQTPSISYDSTSCKQFIFIVFFCHLLCCCFFFWLFSLFLLFFNVGLFYVLCFYVFCFLVHLSKFQRFSSFKVLILSNTCFKLFCFHCVFFSNLNYIFCIIWYDHIWFHCFISHGVFHPSVEVNIVQQTKLEEWKNEGERLSFMQEM